MRIIISGSRGVEPSLDEITKYIEEESWYPTLIISGHAKGPDRIGETWADKHNVNILKMPADWEKYGKSAGHRRNAEMAKHGEALLAFWDGHSKGTANMIEEAKSKGLQVKIIIKKEINFGN